MEQYIPYSRICDLFSRNLETYLQSRMMKRKPLTNSNEYPQVHLNIYFDMMSKIMNANKKICCVEIHQR